MSKNWKTGTLSRRMVLRIEEKKRMSPSSSLED